MNLRNKRQFYGSTKFSAVNLPFDYFQTEQISKRNAKKNVQKRNYISTRNKSTYAATVAKKKLNSDKNRGGKSTIRVMKC